MIKRTLFPIFVIIFICMFYCGCKKGSCLDKNKSAYAYHDKFSELVGQECSQIISLYKEPDSDGWDYVSRDTIYTIYNMDKTIYSEIRRDTLCEKEDGEPYCDELKNNVIAYYPYYGLYYMFCEEYDSQFVKVRIGNGWKLIKKSQPHLIQKTDSLLLTLFYAVCEEDTLWSENRKNRVKFRFKKTDNDCKILFVDGEWIQIRHCDKVFWTKWRKQFDVLQGRLKFF